MHQVNARDKCKKFYRFFLSVRSVCFPTKTCNAFVADEPWIHEFCFVNKRYICFLRSSSSWANFSLVVLINIVPKKASFHMFVSNNVQTIGTIIWKHYPDTDHKRPGGTSKTTSIYPGDRDDRVNFEAIMHMETLSDDWDERDDWRLSLNRRWKRNHESWINKVTKHIRIMKLSFKNLGIMNLCTSVWESRIIVTRLWEKLNKIHVWINCVRSRWCRVWRFRDSLQFSNFSPGQHAPRSPYIIRAFRTDSPLVSPITWCLMFSYNESGIKLF